MTRPLRGLLAAALLVSLATVSCSVSGGRHGGTGSDAATLVLDFATGSTDAAVDPYCHEQQFTPQKVGDPDILLLMDVSASMADTADGNPSGPGNPSKYDQTSAAVSTVLTNLEQAGAPIEWGLIMFPGSGSCDVKSAPDVPVAAGNAATISSNILPIVPNGGGTPTRKAVDLGASYYPTLSDGRSHYMLIATDGEPNCDTNTVFCSKDSDCDPGLTCVMMTCTYPNNSSPTTIAIAHALQAGIRTFVLGIDTGGDSAMLNKMAEEGGTARPGSTEYYPVTDQASLQQALTAITAQIIACYFSLDTLPLDLNYVTVTIGGVAIPRDTTHADGWDIITATKSLVLYGDACTALQANPAAVSVDYECPPAPPS